MKKIVELYVNSTKEAAKILSDRIAKELISQNYEIVEKNADIVIGFGGDGTLLNFLRDSKYNTGAKYIGVNCGTLGFMQDFEVEDIKEFVKNIPNYITSKLRFISIEVINGKDKKNFYALNEFNVQNSNDKSFRTRVEINDEFLENYIGTGIIFSTPTGSTAHNLSSVGCIIHPEINVIQITPREAIANSKMHCLPKSICVPESSAIALVSGSNEGVKIFSDGANVYDGDYDRINIYYSNRSMIKLTDKKHSFVKKIREKLI